MSLHLHALKKSFVAPDGSVSPVVDVDALALRDGEQVALMGTSGSGKTTLLHLIAGILPPDSGKIVYDLTREPAAEERDAPTPLAPPAAGAGAASVVLDYKTAPVAAAGVVDIAQLSEAARDVFRGRYVGYIFQTHHLLPGFTALENVLLGMSFTGRGADKPWAKHLLNQVGLFDRHDYKPAKLSVGQQQRVAVARALANRPRLVLADEPTGALDAVNAQQVLDLVRRLCHEVGATLLLVSHDQQIARQLPRVLQLPEVNKATRRPERPATPIAPAAPNVPS